MMADQQSDARDREPQDDPVPADTSAVSAQSAADSDPAESANDSTYTSAMAVIDEAMESGALAARLRGRLAKLSMETPSASAESDQPQLTTEQDLPAPSHRPEVEADTAPQSDEDANVFSPAAPELASPAEPVQEVESAGAVGAISLWFSNLRSAFFGAQESEHDLQSTPAAAPESALEDDLDTPLEDDLDTPLEDDLDTPLEDDLDTPLEEGSSQSGSVLDSQSLTKTEATEGIDDQLAWSNDTQVDVAPEPTSPLENEAVVTPPSKDTAVPHRHDHVATRPRREPANGEAASRLVSDGQRPHVTFTRQGMQILRLDQGVRAVSNSLRSARSTIGTLKAGDRVDPTRPTLFLMVALICVTTIAAASILLAGAPDWRKTPQNEATPTATVEPSAKPSVAPPATAAAPQIDSIEVISYGKDDGDHPEMVPYMLDGDPNTVWQSRYFDTAELPDDNKIQLLIHLKEATTVSQVVLTGPVEGGQVDLRINDGSDPFGTQVLTSAKMGSTTTLSPSNPVEGNTVTLSFYALPTDDEGRYRVKLSALEVK